MKRNILDELSQNEIKKLPLISIKKGEILFHEDEICNHVGIIKKGLLEISSYSLSGQEIVYSHLERFDIFGNNLIFSSDNKYRGNVIALEDSEIYLIRKSVLCDLLKTNESFFNLFMQINSDFAKELNSKIKILSFLSAEDRLIYYLEINDKTIRFKSVTYLAKILNLSRETLSRLITKLVKKNVIRKERNRLILLPIKIRK